MKQYMVLVSMIILGVCIFNVVAGDNEDSMAGCLQGMWQQGVQVRTYTP